VNCPQCGRFMSLLETEGWRVLQSAYVWCCSDEDCLCYENPIAAPEYEWRYWGISEQEMEELHVEDPETFQAFEAMRERYRRRRGES
jgi:hypothetical protein